MADKKALAQLFEDGAVQTIITNMNDDAASAAVGPDLDDMDDAEEANLVVLVLDNSVSMSGHRDAVIDGANNLIDSLQNSKESDTMLMTLWKFDTRNHIDIIFANQKMADVKPITTADYDADGDATAEYTAAERSLAGALAYAQDLLKNARYRVRVMWVLITDGQDNSSLRDSAKNTKVLIENGIHDEILIPGLVAFGYDPKKVASDIGIPEKNILTSDPSEIRAAMGVVSSSVIRASKAATGTVSSHGFFTQ